MSGGEDGRPRRPRGGVSASFSVQPPQEEHLGVDAGWLNRTQTEPVGTWTCPGVPPVEPIWWGGPDDVDPWPGKVYPVHVDPRNGRPYALLLVAGQVGCDAGEVRHYLKPDSAWRRNE